MLPGAALQHYPWFVWIPFIPKLFSSEDLAIKVLKVLDN